MSKVETVKAPNELLQAQKLANLLDTAVKLPIVPVRLGLDFLVGLIPGIGDALMLFVALRIVYLGRKMGLPKPLVQAMLKNAVVDFGLGFIPFVGDLVDLFYKANEKNVRIMEKWWVSQNKQLVDEATTAKLAEWEQRLLDAEAK